MCLSSVIYGAEIELQDLALPTDTKDLRKISGAVYYSTTNKNKALMPVHFWGEVGRPGLHYIPVDTSLVKGLSFAGGGGSTAKLDDLNVNRLENGTVTQREFDLSGGGGVEAHNFMLKPGDTVFIKKNRFYENRAYYTSLIGVAVSILSTVLLFRAIQERN